MVPTAMQFLHVAGARTLDSGEEAEPEMCDSPAGRTTRRSGCR